MSTLDILWTCCSNLKNSSKCQSSALSLQDAPAATVMLSVGLPLTSARSPRFTKCTCVGDLVLSAELHWAPQGSLVAGKEATPCGPPSLLWCPCGSWGGEGRGRRHLVHPPSCSWPPPTQLGSWPRAEVPSWETLSENTIKGILKEKITNLTTLTHFTHLLKNYLPGLVHECMFSCNISLMCILFYFNFFF